MTEQWIDMINDTAVDEALARVEAIEYSRAFKSPQPCLIEELDTEPALFDNNEPLQF